MATLLLALGLVFALLTANSLWPPHRPGTLAVIAWFPSWLVSELPIHFGIVQAALATGLVADGALAAPDAWPAAWIGLGLVVASSIGLGVHVRRSLHAAHVVDAALDAGLGGDHAARAQLHFQPMTRQIGFWSLAGIFPARPRAVERIRDLVYHRAGRRRLCLDVYRPADPSRRRAGAPVFLYVHGGAWVIGNKGQQGRLTVHRLAEAGWVCVSINYRLSPWATFPDHICDVKRAIRWVREHVAEYGGDPRFVVIGGGSAGAHLASLAALTPNALEYQREFPDVDTSVQGCVAYYGVYDFADRDGSFRHRAFRNLLLEKIVMKRRFAEAPEEYERASPRWRLGPHAPPFLMLHGTCDSLAPLAGAHRFRDALRAVSSAPVVWVELPGAQHAFEIFPSLRSAAVVVGVERFCNVIHAHWVARENSQPAQVKG